MVTCVVFICDLSTWKSEIFVLHARYCFSVGSKYIIFNTSFYTSRAKQGICKLRFCTKSPEGTLLSKSHGANLLFAIF